MLPSVPMMLWSQHLASHYYLHIKLQLQVSKCHAWTTGPCFGQLHYIRHPASQCDASKKVTWRGSPIGEQSWAGVLFKIVNKKLFLMHASRLVCPPCMPRLHCWWRSVVYTQSSTFYSKALSLKNHTVTGRILAMISDCGTIQGQWKNRRKQSTNFQQAFIPNVMRMCWHVMMLAQGHWRHLRLPLIHSYLTDKESKLLRDTRGSHPSTFPRQGRAQLIEDTFFA